MKGKGMNHIIGLLASIVLWGCSEPSQFSAVVIEKGHSPQSVATGMVYNGTNFSPVLDITPARWFVVVESFGELAQIPTGKGRWKQIEVGEDVVIVVNELGTMEVSE